MTSTAAPRPAIRPVIEGTNPSSHGSVRRALDILHGPPGGIEALASDLATGLSGGREDVRVDRPYRLLYATDASIYEMEPVAVVFPRSTADVQHIVRVAAARGVPVLPRGGGTSLAGQGVNHAIVIDMSRHMDQVLEINAEERWARVQPGVVVDALTKAGRPHGLMYAVDPSPKNRATIGGGIGNNSCGAHSVIYGKTLDQVLSLEVVLSDGTTTRFEHLTGAALGEKRAAQNLEGAIYRGIAHIAAANADEVRARFPKIQRRVSGYNLDEFLPGDGFADSMDLARMVVGSEGTLAVVTEAKVRLAQVPRAKGVAALHFPTVASACRATMAALEHHPSSVEIVGSTIIERCRESVGYARLVDFVIGNPGALLLVEMYGDTPEDVAASLARLTEDFAARNLTRDVVLALDAGSQARMWRMREAGLGLLMSVRGDAKPVAYVEDPAVPPERLGDFIEAFDALVRRHGTESAYYGHASVGCMHLRPMANIKSEVGLATMEAIATEVADLVLQFGGSLSGEHGDGILRGVFTERMFGPQLTEAFREVKRTFDPLGILNPGKIVDTPAFNDNLRLSPVTRSLQPPTILDWSHEQGFARAAEQCNGQGACRKDEGGMCPSYMVTRDEEQSTRGRANLLRLVLDGVLPPEDLTGDRLMGALDLCVECKACLAECPSGVDMAKLKQEVLAAHRTHHGLPLRARLVGAMPQLSRLAVRLGPLLAPLQTLGALPPARWALERILGIHHARPLPRIHAATFSRWFAARPSAVPGRRRDAVYFVDTFTEYQHPEVGRAAVSVLEALGYRVRVVPQVACCGRTLLSSGQLAAARDLARANIEQLRPYAAAGTPIVGTEPSCLLALRDEYLSLVPTEDARTVADAAVLLDELVARLASEDSSVASLFRPLDRPAVLHAHCHQKAIAGAEPTLAALSLVPGLSTTLVDSACCGMAGSFGFEAEHYDVSLAMARRSLIPALDDAPSDAEVLVTGISCRQQVEHLSTRRPRHTAELLAEALRRGQR
ncbi:MAG: FAD-binding oxidoreductase [Dehalococcoidia bacterium]|nr:MAG: FAD-binding oxidoreductase [Dehalococcoidia bacterium]